MPSMRDLASCLSLDSATSYAICGDIGERLRDAMKRPDDLPPHLSALLRRLEEQERTETQG